MIVTCPNCNCQFKIGLAVFGREGRNVKCSACKETWWQEPSLEDVTEEIVEEAQQDIYESEEMAIAEAAEVTEEDFARLSQRRVDEFEDKQGRMLAYYVAGGLFLIIFVYLLLTSTSMMKAHPSMQGFYKFFGIEKELPDTLSIMLEGVKAERAGTEVIASGRIVNLSRRDWALPMIEVVVFRPVIGKDDDKHEEIIAQWVETPPEPTLSAEMETSFSYSRHVSFGEKMHEGDSQEQEGKEDMYMARVHFVVRPQMEVEEIVSVEADEQDEAHEDALSSDSHDTKAHIIHDKSDTGKGH